MARCLRCPADTDALHGLCDDCLTADVVKSRATQGLPPEIPADSDAFARIDAATRPTHGPVTERAS